MKSFVAADSGRWSADGINYATGKKMRDYLQKQTAILENPQQVNDLMMDGQVLADIKWFLGFVRGAEVGLEEC